ncbi:MAG: pyridoxamine 5'-phosphate oxidase family protein [Proteobacteria bacterium]|nr:pyridoxamine 5'-phosphate oxidase family protein [Pseudomonadota bacterium]
MTTINKELKKIIEENVLALATVDGQGNPHCIAVAFVKVVAGNQLLITDNYMVETKDNIKKKSKVALSVWNKEWRKDCVGYALKGVAQYFTTGKQYDAIKNIPENKHEHCKGAIIVTINKIKRLA